MISRRRFVLTALMAASGLCLAPGAFARPQPRYHVVRSGETLSSIAARHGLTVAALKTHNGLTSDVIRPGQRLLLPVIGVLQHIVDATRTLRIERGRWRHVVAHHSGIAIGNAAKYDAAHRQRGMENGLAYHFVIGNGTDSPDGSIEIGPRWLRQLDGGHVRAREFNQSGIGICLVGNFEERSPSMRQVKSFTLLVDWLREEAPLGARPKFTVHRWVDRNHTVCPGRNFPYTRLRLRYA
jgi:hypothetical protein